MRVKLVKYYQRFVLILLAIIFIFTINGTIERQYVKQQIHEFVMRGEYIKPSDTFNYDDNIERYYIVRKKHDYEDVNANTYNHNTANIGTTGDILLTNRNPLPYVEFLDPIIIHFWIGHAALVVSDDGGNVIEVVGNDTLDSNKVIETENIFSYSYLFGEEVIGVRVKNITSEQKENIKLIKENYLGKNYSFLFPITLTNRYYCIDLITRLLNDVNIKTNYDFWVSTGNDIITNKNTYMFYYSYVDKEGIVNKYFLE